MALDTLTLEQLQETRQSIKNQLSRVSGIQAEAVKDQLAEVEDMIRKRQDERRLQRIQ
jgi:gas vesicle protein